MSRLLRSSITEGDATLLTQSDRELIESVSSAKRKREITAWRALLRGALRELGEAEIRYRENGAPYIVGSELNISVSHSSKSVAVLISNTPCGVDIESRGRNFEAIFERYTTPREVALFGEISRCEALPIIWCAKEVLYKVAATEGLDLIEDLEILRVESQQIHARALTKEYSLRFEIDDAEALVYTVG